MPVQKALQTAEGRHLPCPGLGHRQQLLPDTVVHQKHLGVLGQGRNFRAGGDALAPVGLSGAAEYAQGGALSGAVAAQDGQQLAGIGLQVHTLENIGAVLFVAVPDLPQLHAGLGIGLMPGAVRHLLQRGVLGKGSQGISSVADGHGTVTVEAHTAPDPHGGGHGQEHGVVEVSQNVKGLHGRFIRDERALVQDEEPVRHGDHILQTVLADEHGGAQLPVDAADGLQKVRGGDGVQLTGGLVEDEELGLEDHDGGEIQKLLLTAGELVGLQVEPGLDAEEAGHLRDSAPDLGVAYAQTLQTEGQLVPDLVGDDLAVRGLEDEADLRRLLLGGDVIQGPTLQGYGARPLSVGSQNGLELAQEGGFSAAGGARQHGKITGPQGQGHIREDCRFLLRVGKGQILDRSEFHLKSSVRSMIRGMRQSPRKLR